MKGGLNTYGYVGGNPIIRKDVFGLDSVDSDAPPRVPGPPTDVFSPGTPANDAFVDSTTRALDAIGDAVNNAAGTIACMRWGVMCSDKIVKVCTLERQPNPYLCIYACPGGKKVWKTNVDGGECKRIIKEDDADGPVKCD